MDSSRRNTSSRRTPARSRKPSREELEEYSYRRIQVDSMIVLRIFLFIEQEMKQFIPEMVVLDTTDDLEYTPVTGLLEIWKKDKALDGFEILPTEYWQRLLTIGIVNAIRRRIERVMGLLNRKLLCGISQMTPQQLSALIASAPAGADMASLVARRCSAYIPVGFDLLSPAAFFMLLIDGEYVREIFSYRGVYEKFVADRDRIEELLDESYVPDNRYDWTGDPQLPFIAATLLKDLRYTSIKEDALFGPERAVTMSDMLRKGEAFVCACCPNSGTMSWTELVSIISVQHLDT